MSSIETVLVYLAIVVHLFLLWHLVGALSDIASILLHHKESPSCNGTLQGFGEDSES